MILKGIQYIMKGNLLLLEGLLELKSTNTWLQYKKILMI